MPMPPPMPKVPRMEVLPGPDPLFMPPLNLWHIPQYVFEAARAKAPHNVHTPKQNAAKFMWENPLNFKFNSGCPGTSTSKTMCFEANVVDDEVHASWTATAKHRWRASGPRRAKGCGISRMYKASTIVTSHVYDLHAVRGKPEFRDLLSGVGPRGPPGDGGGAACCGGGAPRGPPPAHAPKCGGDGGIGLDDDDDYSDSDSRSSSGWPKAFDEEDKEDEEREGTKRKKRHAKSAQREGDAGPRYDKADDDQGKDGGGGSSGAGGTGSVVAALHAIPIAA